MLKHCYVIESQGHDPYSNLALEELLLKELPKDSLILYLWQNQNTVVIGRNQNSWRECNVTRLEEDGGRLARRLSGGGAVFHDLGNLNFTFLAHKDDYDIQRHLQVIIRALKDFGIDAQFSGRNDILTEGRKFSGNAFYRTQGACYHHGTLLIDVDFSKLSRYLQVSKEKLASKGVASVQSRVINLSELNSELTTDSIRPSLVHALAEITGLPVEPFVLDPVKLENLEKLASRYRSWEWLYGSPFSFEVEFAQRFPWGEVQIQCQVEDGQVKEARVYSDAMAVGFASTLQTLLKGSRYQKEALQSACQSLQGEDEITPEMIADLCSLFAEL